MSKSSGQDIWSYLGFGSSSSSSQPRRRVSVSQGQLPHTSSSTFDPFEKPDRHSGHKYSTSNGSMNGGMNQGQRSRYIKIGSAVAFVLFVLYFLVGRNGGAVTYSAPIRGGDVASDPSVATTRCTKSSSPSKPLIQYVLMIDAGSSGSRIHVYRFNNCGSTPELEHEEFKMTEGKNTGLSSYGEDAEGAAKSLDMLMAVAMETVPDKLKGCSPVAVKATAGLRKLGPDLSDRILKAVRTRLENEYPFPVLSEDKGGVEVMDGKDEGVYAWITANYLLGKIGGPDKTPTAAVFDLGGGSTQIVFQPTFPESKDGGMPKTMEEGDHKYKLTFGGREFDLYQHSYLGWGLNEARSKLNKLIFDAAYEADSDAASRPIVNPCMAPNMTEEVKVGDVKVMMTGPREGSPATCRSIAEKILLKDADCKLTPCAFNGVHQPPLSQTFAREDVYLFSFFYDRTFPIGMPESFTIRELQELTDKVCHGEESGAWDVFRGVEGAVKELKKEPQFCMDLNFMMALLHTGYEMPIDREVRIAKKIKGNELGWCLGASLPLLSQDSGWKCKIKQIS